MKIYCNTAQFEVELYNTPSAKAISEKLPLSGNAILWGQEIYFSIPLNTETEHDARDILEVGEIAFYPPMSAFCIFFGATPISTDDKPRAADRVNVIGKIKGDFTPLQDVKNGELIRITA